MQRKRSGCGAQKGICSVDDIGMCLFSFYEQVIHYPVLVPIGIAYLPCLYQHIALNGSGFLRIRSHVPDVCLCFNIRFRRFPVEENNRDAAAFGFLQNPHDISRRNWIP